jgi:hypothetical protein
MYSVIDPAQVLRSLPIVSSENRDQLNISLWSSIIDQLLGVSPVNHNN